MSIWEVNQGMEKSVSILLYVHLPEGAKINHLKYCIYPEHEWMDGWMDRWIDGQTDIYMNK